MDDQNKREEIGGNTCANFKEYYRAFMWNKSTIDIVNIGKSRVFKEMGRDTNEGWPISPAKGTGFSRFSPKNGSLLPINSFATFF